MNYYNIKKLIKGYRVCPNLKSKTLIAVPQKKVTSNYGFVNTTINYNNQKMTLTRNTPLLHKNTFTDKFNRGTIYTLYYYEWLPNKNQMELRL